MNAKIMHQAHKPADGPGPATDDITGQPRSLLVSRACCCPARPVALLPDLPEQRVPVS
jgi:hypothetical protein